MYLYSPLSDPISIFFYHRDDVLCWLLPCFSPYDSLLLLFGTLNLLYICTNIILINSTCFCCPCLINVLVQSPLRPYFNFPCFCFSPYDSLLIILVLSFVVPVCVFCVFFPFILDINCLMINVLVQSPLRPYLYFLLSIATMSFAGYFLVRSLLSYFPAYLRTFFRFDFVWFRLSVRERILAKFWRASRAEFNLCARYPHGIGAVACMCVRKK